MVRDLPPVTDWLDTVRCGLLSIAERRSIKARSVDSQEAIANISFSGSLSVADGLLPVPKIHLSEHLAL